MLVHIFNSRTGEAEAGGFRSLRPDWSTELVPGQPVLFQRDPMNKLKNKDWNEQPKNCVFYLRGLIIL